MKLLIALLFVPSILLAETVGYEYYIPKTETTIIQESNLMTGLVEDKERYKKIRRSTISTTLDNYAKDGKVNKIIVNQTTDRQGVITAIFERKEGIIPIDYNYSTEEENKKRIQEEIRRLKAIQDAVLEEQAKTNLGL
jgi:hypothetical protein